MPVVLWTLGGRARLVFPAVRGNSDLRMDFRWGKYRVSLWLLPFREATAGANPLFKGTGSACTRRHQGGRATIQWRISEIQHGKDAADWVL